MWGTGKGEVVGRWSAVVSRAKSKAAGEGARATKDFA